MPKIFISLEQTEHLIFNKILIISAEQLKIKRRQSDYSVVISLSNDGLITLDQNLHILLSSIVNFDIVEKDKSIFLNSYKLPKGLITTSDVQVRDPSDAKLNSNSAKNQTEKKESKLNSLNNYSIIRRSLIGIYINLFSEKEFQTKNMLSKLNEMTYLDKYTFQLISELAKLNNIPTLKVKDKVKGIKNDAFFAWVWLGDFTRKFYENLTSEEKAILDIRQWMRALNPDTFTINKLEQQIQTTPNLLSNVQTVILGYHLALIQRVNIKSILHIDGYTQNDENPQIYTKQEEIYFWANFFLNFFDENIDFLYPTESIKSNFIKLEVLALYLASSSTNADQNSIEFNQSISLVSENEKTILDYFLLKRGDAVIEAQVIDEEEPLRMLTEVYSDSPLFANNNNIGFIFNSDNIPSYSKNYIAINKERLTIHPISRLNEITYYGDVDKSYLPKKISIKPLEKIIPRHKKVLLGIFNESNIPDIISLYSTVLDVQTSIKKLIFIWEVTRNQEDLHSAMFIQEQNKHLAYLKNKFKNLDINLLIKNTRNSDDGEIIRLLTQHLQDVKLKNIEIINNKVDEKLANWIIESTNSYIIKNNTMNFLYLNTL